jgi:hypothetical protein
VGGETTRLGLLRAGRGWRVNDSNFTDELQKDLKGGLSFYKEYMFAEFLKQYAQLLDDRIRNLAKGEEL